MLMLEVEASNKQAIQIKQTRKNQEMKEDHIIVQEFCMIILENLKKLSANIKNSYKFAEQ